MTLYKIAELAETSKSTVSRVINGSKQVSDDVRKRVLSIMKEQNYSPSNAARNLSMGKKQTLAVIANGLEEGYYLKILQGISQKANEQGFLLLCSFTYGKEEYLSTWHKIKDGNNCDGAILVAPPNEIYDDPCLNSLAIVICSSKPDQEKTGWENVSTVCFNNKQGMEKLLHYLHLNKKKSSLYIPGHSSYHDAQVRLNVYKNFLNINKDHRGKILKCNALSWTQSGAALLNYLHGKKSLPEVIICYNDAMAASMYSQLKDNGYPPIPIAGFDGEPLASILGFPTVQIPSHQQGVEATRILLQSIANKESIPVHLELDLTLKTK